MLLLECQCWKSAGKFKIFWLCYFFLEEFLIILARKIKNFFFRDCQTLWKWQFWTFGHRHSVLKARIVPTFVARVFFLSSQRHKDGKRLKCNAFAPLLRWTWFESCRCGPARCKTWLDFCPKVAPLAVELWSKISNRKHHQYQNAHEDCERPMDSILWPAKTENKASIAQNL